MSKGEFKEVYELEIRLTNITKTYGVKTVIDDVTLTIESGSFTTLLGPSGCGKTTLLRMIAGLETPDTGEIYFGDKCVFSAEKNINVPPEKRGLGFVFQDFALWPHLTVYENVAFGLRAANNTKDLDRKVKDALRAVQLEGFDKRYPHQMSGGQQQRVAFARAIVIEPECILFDEPLSALDALLREGMRTELKSLISKYGITAIFVTHDQGEAMSMSDKIAVFHSGIVDQYKDPEEVYEHPATEFVARFVGASNWIDGNSMFRPEKAKLEKTGDMLTFETVVNSVQFLGNSYQLQLQYKDYVWSYITSGRMEVGKKLNLYVDEKDIVNL